MSETEMWGIALSPDGKKMVGGCLEGAVGHTYAKSLQNRRDPKQCGLSARWPALVASRLHDETARQGDVDPGLGCALRRLVFCFAWTPDEKTLIDSGSVFRTSNTTTFESRSPCDWKGHTTISVYSFAISWLHPRKRAERTSTAASSP